MNPRSRSLMVCLLLACLGVLSTGCATKYHDYDAFVHRPMPIVTATEYRLSPPDVLMITSSRVPEIKEMQQTVHPDGTIRLPLLGAFHVANKTLEEVREMLTTEARRYYNGADVSVWVVGFRSKKVYVYGHVRQPGPYVYDGANTIMETLSAAQPTDLADMTRIRIVRPTLTRDKEPKRMTINLEEMAHRGIQYHEAVLEEGDVIYVPPTALARVGLALQQLLLPLQPAAATVAAPARISTGFEAPIGGGAGQ